MEDSRMLPRRECAAENCTNLARQRAGNRFQDDPERLQAAIAYLERHAHAAINPGMSEAAAAVTPRSEKVS